MSSTRQRRIRTAKNGTKSKTVPKKTYKTPKTPKQNKNKNSKKPNPDRTIEIDSDCGYEMVKDGSSDEKKRRSKRLRDVRTRKEEESSDSDSDTLDTTKPSKKRKRKQTNDKKAPPKKKAKKTLKKRRDLTKIMVPNPSFTRDKAQLKTIGIAYTKSKASPNRKASKSNAKPRKKRGEKIYYRSTVIKHENREYKWHTNGKYKLLGVLGHKLVHSATECMSETDQMWCNSVNYGPIIGMVNESESMSDVKEESDGSDGSAPQTWFGVLRFECEWEEWGVNTWESWDCICKTEVFAKYCADAEREWTMKKGCGELYAAIDAHESEEFKKIVENMSLFGSPTKRKALKMIVSKQLNVW